jgi:hypothetical protein
MSFLIETLKSMRGCAAAGVAGCLMTGCAAIDRFEKGMDELVTPLMTEALPNAGAGALLRGAAPFSADPQIGQSMDNLGQVLSLQKAAHDSTTEVIIYQNPQIPPLQVPANTTPHTSFVSRGRTPYSTPFLQWEDAEPADKMVQVHELKGARGQYSLFEESCICFGTQVTGKRGQTINFQLWNGRNEVIAQDVYPIPSDNELIYSKTWASILRIKDTSGTCQAVWSIDDQIIDAYVVTFTK